MLYKNKLKKLRLEKGLSIEELSKKADINRRTIYRLERNLNNARDYTIAKLAKALGVSIDEIIDERGMDDANLGRT